VTLNAIKVSKRQANNGTGRNQAETKVLGPVPKEVSDRDGRGDGDISKPSLPGQEGEAISDKFITGTVRAFPEYRLDDLFHVGPSGKHYDGR
jgi:hypothetical protein